jgi:hypothetical protein
VKVEVFDDQIEAFKALKWTMSPGLFEEMTRRAFHEKGIKPRPFKREAVGSTKTKRAETRACD